MSDLLSSRSVRITEIFLSLQGESVTTGIPTVFVRLTGCPLRCGYCDTTYAFHGGEKRSIEEIVSEVGGYAVTHVTVTGGEPLAQPRCHDLLKVLCDQGYRVSLETSGALDVSAVDPRVSRVMDIKTPGSGECDRNLAGNVGCLHANDQIKFVVCDRKDYDWSRDLVRREGLAERCEVLFSPSAGEMEPRDLAEWILEDRLPVRFQIQLHKILWGDSAGH